MASVVVVVVVTTSLEKADNTFNNNNLCSCRACLLVFFLLEKITIKIYVYLALRYSYFCQVELFSEIFAFTLADLAFFDTSVKHELSRVLSLTFFVSIFDTLIFRALYATTLSTVNFEITKQSNLECAPLFAYREHRIVHHYGISGDGGDGVFDTNLIPKVVFARHSTRPLIFFCVEQVYIYSHTLISPDFWRCEVSTNNRGNLLEWVLIEHGHVACNDAALPQLT